MQRRPLVSLLILVGSLGALAALTTLPWVDDQPLWKILSSHGHGYQMAYVVFAPQVLAIAVAGVTFAAPRRWLTALLAVCMLPPTFLAAVVHHGGSGAKVAAAGSALALLAAIVASVQRGPQRAAQAF